MHIAAMPRILLLEDDPVSQAFLSAAAEALPACVDCAATLARARTLASTHAYDLLLADANLPDGRGSDLLHELRRTRAIPALAHTAATARSQRDALIGAGFADVLVKPLSAMQLQQAIRRVLQGTTSQQSPLPGQFHGPLEAWDETAALAAVNGNARQAMQLRALFLADLRAQRDAALAALADADAATLREQLHRLLGGCGFVGATRTAAAVRALMAAPASPAAQLEFAEAIEEALASGAAASG